MPKFHLVQRKIKLTSGKKLRITSILTLLFLLAIIPLTVSILEKQQEIRQHAATSTGWWLRDMGMTAVTHDTVCNQESQANMTRLVSYIPQFHANFASDDVPLDGSGSYNCTFGQGNAPLQPYQYMLNWANTIHGAGLHVIYRGNWNNFAGDYGQAKLSYSTSPAISYESPGGLSAVLNGTDTTSYIGRTYQWILNHPGIFQDGDVWEPFGEPQNNGITNGPAGTSAANCPKSICQFPSTAAFNQWLSDFSQADQTAFRAIGKNVTSGWFGLAGDSYTYVTPLAMSYSSAYNMDHFAQSYSNFTSLIVDSHNAFPNLPMTLEWGDINSADNTPQLVANTTDQYLGWLVQQSYVSGFEYWYESGQGAGAQSAAVDFNTGQMTPAGQIVEKYFAMEETSTTPTPTTLVTPTFTPTPTPKPTSSPTPSVMPSATPTPTPLPGTTTLSFPGILLHGIGSAGDSVAPGTSGNTSPLTPNRTLSVQVVNASNVLVTTLSGTITYSPSSGGFSGSVSLGSTVPTGSYLVKVKTDKYLVKQLPGIITLTQGQTTTIPPVSLIVGDINNDNTLNILDYNILLGCYSDFLPPTSCPGTNGKESDLNDDGSVNASDYNLFLRELSVQSGE